MSVNNSIFTTVFFKHSCRANPGAEKKYEGSSLYISMHLSLNFSKACASKSVLV